MKAHRVAFIYKINSSVYVPISAYDMKDIINHNSEANQITVMSMKDNIVSGSTPIAVTIFARHSVNIDRYGLNYESP